MPRFPPWSRLAGVKREKSKTMTILYGLEYHADGVLDHLGKVEGGNKGWCLKRVDGVVEGGSNHRARAGSVKVYVDYVEIVYLCGGL